MQKLTIFLTIFLLTFSGYAAMGSPATNKNIVEGKQYITLQNPPYPGKTVIEFFSFYCGACYFAEMEYHLPQTIKQSLPKNVVMKKYHVEGFGGLSKELSQAWAIANVLGMKNQVAKALFDGIHKSNSIKTADDIKKIFEKLGVLSEKYEAMKTNFSVQIFLNQQKTAFNQLKPEAIPSFYVNNKYKILSQNLIKSGKGSLANDHSRVINYLIAHDGK